MSGELNGADRQTSDAEAKASAQEDWHAYRALVSRIDEDTRRYLDWDVVESFSAFASRYADAIDRQRLIHDLSDFLNQLDMAVQSHRVQHPRFQLMPHLPAQHDITGSPTCDL